MDSQHCASQIETAKDPIINRQKTDTATDQTIRNN